MKSPLNIVFNRKESFSKIPQKVMAKSFFLRKKMQNVAYEFVQSHVNCFIRLVFNNLGINWHSWGD